MRKIGANPTFFALAFESQRLLYGAGLVGLGFVLAGIIYWETPRGNAYSASDRFLAKEAIVLAAAGAILFAYGVRQVRWWVRLSQHGQETEATITKIKLSRMQPYAGRGRVYLKRPRVATFIAHYQYQDQFGQTHNGRSGLLAEAGELTLKAGDRARIRYDIAHPDESLWIGET